MLYFLNYDRAFSGRNLAETGQNMKRKPYNSFVVCTTRYFSSFTYGSKRELKAKRLFTPDTNLLEFVLEFTSGVFLFKLINFL